MATNIIYDRIFKGLKLVLGRRCLIGNDNAPKSADYIVISLESTPELLENTGASFSMLYSVNIDYVTNRAKKAEYITQEMSNIIRKLNDNPAKTTGGVYYWHDGQVLPGEPEEGEGFTRRILWTATHTELK